METLTKQLYQAACQSSLSRLQSLLQQGADPNAEWRGYPPLHALTFPNPHKPVNHTADSFACIDVLLAHGADPHLPGGFPRTSVYFLAAFAGAASIVARLRAAKGKADPLFAAAEGKLRQYDPLSRDAYGFLPLHYVAGSRIGGSGLLKVATRLLDAGADPNAEDLARKHRVTPIYLAGNAGQRDMFELLLSRGANPEQALTNAMWNAPDFEVYGRLALAHGANIDRATANGKPLLNHLIQWGRLRHATWLLNHGASPLVKDKDGWTALHQAASRGNARMIETLLAHGADPTAKDKLGHTPADVDSISRR